MINNKILQMNEKTTLYLDVVNFTIPVLFNNLLLTIIIVKSKVYIYEIKKRPKCARILRKCDNTIVCPHFYPLETI